MAEQKKLTQEEVETLMERIRIKKLTDDQLDDVTGGEDYYVTTDEEGLRHMYYCMHPETRKGMMKEAMGYGRSCSYGLRDCGAATCFSCDFLTSSC